MIWTAFLSGSDLADGANQTEAFTEPLMVLLRDPEEVRDHQHGERLGVRANELAAAGGDEFVELPIGEALHELLATLESLGREKTHEQPPLTRVVWGVHGDHVFAQRKLIPVPGHDVAHVVALERHREGRVRADDRHGVH